MKPTMLNGIRRRSAHTWRGRRGVSLLEVLISIFVLSFGLMGVAALIPLGRYALVETGKADRSAACGRAGMRDVKVQRMLDPARWWNPAPVATGLQNDTGTTFANPSGYTTTQWPNRGQSFCIDPLGLYRYASAGGAAVDEYEMFPLDVTSGPACIHMPRIALDTYLIGGPTVMPLALAERVFTWRDELLFETNEDEATYRPERLYSLSGGTGFGTDASAAVVGEAEGNYSWMATVTPAASEAPLGYADKKTYTVSIVVFYKRDFEVDGVMTPERPVQAVFVGNGLGGGDVKLCTTVDDRDYLTLREKQWIMLCGQVADERFGSGAVRNVFKWYRVVLTDDEPHVPETSDNPVPANTEWLRYATLAGPDWNGDWNLSDTSGDGTNDTTYAALVDGVIGVYTTTIEFDQ